MTEMSYWWTTGGAGDGASEYTRSDHQWSIWIISACFGGDGVGPTFLNALVGSVPGVNTARIATGVAIVDGKPYRSNANVDVTIPSAVGGGNTRIDRVVLRCSWSAQTVRITRISGTDAASPTAPALTQVSGTTYDIPLYQALVNTGGTVTLTDERQFAKIDTGDIADLAILSGKIGANEVIAGKLANGAVDTEARLANNIVGDTKMRDSGACSVIGRSANSSGDPADIVASINDRVLARSGDTISFVQVAQAMLADDSVDDTKAGNRVARFVKRQGGDASSWVTGGTSNYTPTGVIMQGGSYAYSNSSSIFSGNFSVTFPTAFSQPPLAFAIHTQVGGGALVTGKVICQAIATATTLTVYFSIADVNDTQYPATGNLYFQWFAIGPE